MSYVRSLDELLALDCELAALLRDDANAHALATGAVLLQYQQEWICDPAQVKIFEKSRRIGITWATAAECVLQAASGLQDVWYVNYSEDGAKEFIRDCAAWCERFKLPAERLLVTVNDEDDKTADVPEDMVRGLTPQTLLDWDDDGEAKGVRALQIRFPSGKRITALTSNPRNLRGKQGIVVIDEAAFHNDLAELLKAAIALKMWGGKIWLLSTHNGADNPFALLCDDVRDGKKPFSLHKCTIKQALAQGLYQRICIELAIKGADFDPSEEGKAKWLADLELEYGDGADEELYCVPTGSGASYIGRALVIPCEYEAPVIRYEQTDEWLVQTTEPERVAEVDEWCDAVLGPLLDQVEADDSYRAFAFGLDFARVSDLTVLAPMGVTQQLQRKVPFMVELRNVPFNQQYQVVSYVMRRLPHLMFSALDAGGNGSWVAEQAWLNFGLDDHVERVMLNLGYYRDNMPALRQAFEDRIIRIPRDADVRRDIAQVRRFNGIPKIADVRTKDTKKDGVKRHGDAAVALFLANAAARKAEEIWARWDALSSP
jgi:phage FluMu gp28-like protein